MATETLRSLFPTAKELLAQTPEELGPVLLQLALSHHQSGGMFWPDGAEQAPLSITGEPGGYPYHNKAAVEALLNEAWGQLGREGLIMPAPDASGRNGWMVFTRAGEEAASSTDVRARSPNSTWRTAAALPATRSTRTLRTARSRRGGRSVGPQIAVTRKFRPIVWKPTGRAPAPVRIRREAGTCERIAKHCPYHHAATSDAQIKTELGDGATVVHPPPLAFRRKGAGQVGLCK